MAETLEAFAQPLRLNENLSHTELGLLAGLHCIHIGRFARGALHPGGDTLMCLADEDKNVVKKLHDAFLTKKHFQALTR